MKNIAAQEKKATFLIEGKRRLCGEIETQGAKNSALPILAATILSEDSCVIENCPRLSDIDTAADILKHLGCKVKFEGNTVYVDPSAVNDCKIPDSLMREMRSSIVFLGAIAARYGEAKVSLPGGCELGPRPIDLHLKALRKMGVEIKEEHGFLNCKVRGKIHGEEINLPFPSVGATENVMIAGSTAQGTTVINNAAREPEIADLADFLNNCGADITGAGESVIIIRGKDKLHGSKKRVMPDRIAAATYMAAAAATEGEVTLRNADFSTMGVILPEFIESGCEIKRWKDAIKIKADKRVSSFGVLRTMPYPGFPTDAQAPFMALSTVADGDSIFVETIFENRYRHVGELKRLGANIATEGKVAIVKGVKELTGAEVRCSDLRGGAAVAIAALTANGKSRLFDVFHIDRGYEDFEGRINSLGGKIIRE